ncbi:DUF5050 domain-containing protein [Clostridium nigeriense]|uniref:DUF5050 domain-containing protein n=1 Tax=Clostridium nigeriense TaxID=1805470 RepID=UPI000A0648B6|nr:DUF5050 domain-containing protein [Clostridium nigeriense]
MIRKMFLLIIISSFLLVGCSNDTNTEIKEENETKITTSYKQTVDTSKKIIFSGKTLSNSKYVSLGNLVFFPDINNNNKLSAANTSNTSDTIGKNSIIDIFDFNVTSLSTDGNYIYFSSIAPEKGLYKLDYEKKEITKINNYSPAELIYENEKLYYINSNDNKFYYYNIKNKQTYLLSNSTSNSFIFNNNSIFYINYNDGSKLYCLKTDGSANFKITDTAVESFVIYDNEILFSNPNDNNYIYSLDISNLQTKKVLDLSSSNLKQNENNIYFINNEDPNSLYKLLPNKETSDYEYNKVFSDYVNEYYPTAKGIFIEAANNLDSIKFISEN